MATACLLLNKCADLVITMLISSSFGHLGRKMVLKLLVEVVCDAHPACGSPVLGIQQRTPADSFRAPSTLLTYPGDIDADGNAIPSLRQAICAYPKYFPDCRWNFALASSAVQGGSRTMTR